jgi:hypothetical protein
MKLGHKKRVLLKEDILDVGLSDDLEKYAKRVSDKSGTEVVKQNDVVRDLDYMNQKGEEIRKDVDKYDTEVAKQLSDSVKEIKESLTRKYLRMIESECKTNKMAEDKFKFKPTKFNKAAVFEEVTMPKRKKISKPTK